MNNIKKVRDAILSQGMLPLFFHKDFDISLQVTKALYAGGVRVLEYTNRGPEALQNFKQLKKAQQEQMPGLHLGIGTIKTKQEANEFVNAGADFIVAPIVNPAVAEVAHRHDLLWCPGCMTPTEIFAAQQNGAGLIKLFPANILGPAFLSAVKELFPDRLFMPTGGVELNMDNLGGWFKAGVCAVGLGSKLITKDILNNRLYDQLYADTQNALKLIQTVMQAAKPE